MMMQAQKDKQNAAGGAGGGGGKRSDGGVGTNQIRLKSCKMAACVSDGQCWRCPERADKDQGAVGRRKENLTQHTYQTFGARW